MSDGLVIRRAERRDAAELAILVDIASHGFASWLWYGAVLDGHADTAMERGRARMRDEAVDDGWRNASIAEIDGAVVGASVGHPVPADILNEISPHPSLAPLISLQQLIVDYWFIDSLAVYKPHRGTGVGRKLLEHELSLAEERVPSLITESHNSAALSLYKAFGFAEQARRDAFKTSEKSEPFQWVLLTRPSSN